MNLENLANQRFYAAKSEPITGATTLASAPAGDATLMLARIERPSGHDTYQLLIDAHGNDVLANPDASCHLTAALAAGTSHGLGELHQLGAPVPGGTPRPLHGEQSNNSLIVGDTIIKFFRRLEPGLNPDVELLIGMSSSNCPHIVPIRAWVSYQDYVLAVAQNYLPDGEDAWSIAKNSETFHTEARAIGQATRSVHNALATAFPTSVVPASDITRRLDERLDQHIRRAPLLSDYADQARELYHSLDGHIPTQRIHGDLHLGQILRSNNTYKLIDFEGEPAIPLEQRRQPDTPLRDVAGLIRSLDYAGHSDATNALLDGYQAGGFGVAGAGGAGSGGAGPLLDCFILDKALYEVAYETNNRPDWLHIPLGAVQRLLG